MNYVPSEQRSRVPALVTENGTMKGKGKTYMFLMRSLEPIVELRLMGNGGLVDGGGCLVCRPCNYSKVP